MRYYYSPDGISKKGPNTVDELLSMQLPESTLYWVDGMEHWKRASEIDDFIPPPPPPILNQVEDIPPPIVTASIPKEEPVLEITNSSYKKKRKKWLLWTVPLLISLVIGGYFLYTAIESSSDDATGEGSSMSSNESQAKPEKKKTSKAKKSKKNAEAIVDDEYDGQEEPSSIDGFAEDQFEERISAKYNADLLVEQSSFRGIDIGRTYPERWAISVVERGLLYVSVYGGSSFNLSKVDARTYSGSYREKTFLGYRDFYVKLTNIQYYTGEMRFTGTKLRRDGDGSEALFSINAIETY